MGIPQGRAQNSQGKASLRSLYAYFIDKELADIGAKTAKFAQDARKEFENKWDRMSSAKIEGRDDAFENSKGHDSWCTAKKLKFPRPSVTQGASVYGAYGWKGVTHLTRQTRTRASVFRSRSLRH
ncbi:hypothetical protein CH35J_001664 [Colletotrichum higginsianum]|uniref:Uncharacterized protein n=1 Tax=Colletotrichum higginsianum TaxID=80884 RepID=A0A4T0WL26_9PEZI|nr:hypothetical protein CH35J_001664 [Colletotrichum higginsianum]